MIPKGLEHHHFLEALREIDAKGVPEPRASRRYDLILHGKAYPPKYVISIATRIATGTEWKPGQFNAVEAKAHFKGRGFTILDRSAEDVRAVSKIAEENEESRIAEGNKEYRLHRALERDRAIATKAKAFRLFQGQDLRCDACDFSFFESYGKLGEGYIEAHHTVPVSELQGKRKTKISEFALLCSNCHRIIHRSRPMLSVAAVRALVELNRGEELNQGVE